MDQVLAGGCEQVVEAEGADEDADEDYGDGGVFVHGWVR